MKVLGVDASSSSTGYTLLDDDEIVKSEIWTPASKKALASDRLFEYYMWISGQLYTDRPELVGVSTTSFSRSHRTTRVLARYEAATIIAARLYSCIVVEIKDSEARKWALSRGNYSKEQVYDRVTAINPDFVWLPFGKGGDDQTDSWVLATAAPFIDAS